MCYWVRHGPQLVISEVRLDGMGTFGDAKDVRFSAWKDDHLEVIESCFFVICT